MDPAAADRKVRRPRPTRDIATLPAPAAPSKPSTQRLVVSLFSAHPLMLERMRLQLDQKNIDIHAYLLPVGDRFPELELLPSDVYIVDSYGARAIELVIAYIRARQSRPQILVVRDSFENAVAFPLLFLGVRGLVRYDRIASELVRALYAIGSGAYWVPRLQLAQFVDYLLERFPHPEQLSPLIHLTSGEQQVMEGLLNRLSNKEIADRLTLSERTVKFHVSNLLRKYRLRRRYDLVFHILQHAAADPSLALPLN